MIVTIYHNPKCGTSRNVLGLIRAAGIEPVIVEYLKTPLDRHALAALITRIGAPVRDVMRRSEALYGALNLDDPALGDNALIAAMVQHPILLQRPIVVTERGAKLCRPSETVKEIL